MFDLGPKNEITPVELGEGQHRLKMNTPPADSGPGFSFSLNFICHSAEFGNSIRRPWLRILTGTSVSVFFCCAVWSNLRNIEWFLEIIKFDWFLGIITIPTILGLLAISLGVGAYIFRKKRKMRYGQIEVFVGILSAIGITNATRQSIFAQSISLAAAAYVIARGLNNWDEALRENGDNHGNRSIWEQVRNLLFEEPQN